MFLKYLWCKIAIFAKNNIQNIIVINVKLNKKNKIQKVKKYNKLYKKNKF